MNTKNKTGEYVYNYLVSVLNFKPDTAKLITAQSAHETGNFSSTIFKENNNLFGMKNAGQELATGVKYEHATYESLENSIKDFARYFWRSNYPENFTTVENYVQTLKNHKYFEGDIQAYTEGVKHFLNLYFIQK